MHYPNLSLICVRHYALPEFITNLLIKIHIHNYRESANAVFSTSIGFLQFCM